MINRKPIFQEMRDLLGRGLTQAEVDSMDAAIDEAEGKDLTEAEGWVALAAPFVEEFEGMAEKIGSGNVKAYPDPATGGKPWTIGIGSTTDEKGHPIQPGEVWSEERARARFKAHLMEFGRQVDIMLGGALVTPEQKAAITSWTYNVGSTAAAKSTLIRKHKAGDYKGAADEFLRWNKANGKVMRGLTRRREAERALYLGN